MKNVLVIGGGAREHAIVEACVNSKPRPNIFAWMKKILNPGIAALADKVSVGNTYQDLMDFVRACNDISSLAVIGPEEPLDYGVADSLDDISLEAIGIPTVGPRQELARLETSKSFTRLLMEKYQIPSSPKFKIFITTHGIEEYLERNMPVVLKPDGLTGGKGVQVQGEHFETMAEALKICQEILREHWAVVVEEKLDGEEFSLQCFTDGRIVAPTPPVRDHKRLFTGDQGPNTGGMGSYSCANHLLPFLTPSDLDQALAIIRRVIAALYMETGQKYKGIIYGNFMATADGVKVIEFNARFGDPEALNILPLLETDFMDICRSIVLPEKYGRLNELNIKFKPLATVVKYVVPRGYGLPENIRHPARSDIVRIGDMGKAKLYYASVWHDKNGLHLTSSRALAVLGISPDLVDAEKIADRAACNVAGHVAYRPDIGTAELIAKQVQHMNELKKNK